MGGIYYNGVKFGETGSSGGSSDGSGGSSTTVLYDPVAAVSEYDASRIYDVGDYCIYEGVLMKCITDIYTPEQWNSSHWSSNIDTDDLIITKKIRLINEVGY